MRRFTGLFAVLAAGLVLSACGGGEDDELQQWLAAQRSATQPKVQPISAPKEFKPQPYADAGSVEPFGRERLTQALQRESSQSTPSAALVAPELARAKEALEAYPLDAMAMVGSLLRDGRTVALVRVNSLLYQVRPGEYLGQNYGRVTKITETEVALREIVQDAAGEWIERMASLQLQEGSK